MTERASSGGRTSPTTMLFFTFRMCECREGSCQLPSCSTEWQHYRPLRMVTYRTSSWVTSSTRSSLVEVVIAVAPVAVVCQFFAVSAANQSVADANAANVVHAAVMAAEEVVDSNWSSFDTDLDKFPFLTPCHFSVKKSFGNTVLT